MAERPHDRPETARRTPPSPLPDTATPTTRRPRCASAWRTSGTSNEAAAAASPPGDTHMQELIDKIERRSARCGVIGLGYVGLPLALEFAQGGLPRHRHRRRRAQGAGDPARARRTSSTSATRRSPRRCGPGSSRATTDFSVIRELDTINICVPTPLRKTKDPDLTYVVVGRERDRDATCVAGQLVILESTTYPGTTEEVVRPALEASGLEVGQDFCLAFSPERIDPGNASSNTRNIPKVVGGVDAARCTQVAKRLYEAVGRHGRAGLVHAGRGDGEAPREHLPQRQHRAGERDRAHVQRARDRRVGGDRRRQDEAVRLHGRSTPGRASAGTASRSIRSTCPGRRR